MSAGTVVGDICAVADVEWLWAEAELYEREERRKEKAQGRTAEEELNPRSRKTGDRRDSRQAEVSGEEISGEVEVGGRECPPHKCPAQIGGRDCPNWQECFGRQEGAPHLLLSNGSSLRSFSGQWLTGKQRGELAEAAFMVKAASLGFGVAKPWGDSDRYDFIVDVEKRLWRVQVKSAHRMGEDGSYSFRLHTHSLEAYTAAEIDVLVAYVVPEDDWYVFPVRELGRLRSLKLFPGSRRKRSRFERWREAWWVFGGIVDF